MNGNKTISGKLAIGVEFNGRLHRDFVLRLSTVGDEIDVAEDMSVPDAGYKVGLVAVCLDKLGDIPAEQITYKLLRSLDSDDYRHLLGKQEELKKKRNDSKGDTATSDTPSSD